MKYVFLFIGIEYHFVARSEMEQMLTRGEFLESTEFSSNLYGTRLLNKKQYLFYMTSF
jgi:guanylate kinase